MIRNIAAFVFQNGAPRPIDQFKIVFEPKGQTLRHIPVWITGKREQTVGRVGFIGSVRSEKTAIHRAVK
ncbi:MAG: hypothetical protein B6D77_10280 [gamma proteobacterium symbiont of Ctena orbiculata]|nr:MAG: hypothetical protein B6D77_10280 [gamma proteobacterium symbiont of Ctena orbiculata]PVV17625.1 MAG: hypothetical protein B6D78_18245 [gamma proteobacterium symbiont of Ctena orbiculata]